MNIFDMYGIKEVADVAFYDIESGAPVLFLDTLKVSTIEETSSNSAATGGKGNSPLVKWDYGKEMTLTLEDALFSMKSMAFMQGGTVRRKNEKIQRTERVIAIAGEGDTGVLPGDLPSGATVIDEKGETVTTFVVGETYLVSWKEDVTNAESITISADSFPGTYKVVGDTYARNYKTGKDEFFQFVIPMAKVNFENTITMSADGDPSTFSMTLTVLRPEDGDMLKFYKYPKSEAAEVTDDSIIIDFGR